ncbi:response regulator transcription factor [Amycolatopsis benzoatilytica]|uniref:response regulator transcription factor n=1 Tax=Amycolatopsis benzoatilytica TaxID=346045 RepID=UPI000377170B|nr:response regulator transcription factor [Amycolatopsis benzoatilytica]
MDTNTVVLILGVLIVLGVLMLLWRGQKGSQPSTLKVSLSDLFKMDLSLSPQNRAQAEQDLRKAEQEKAPGAPPGTLPELRPTRALTRVLWIDDHPERNVHETVALENLGKLVTVATSDEAARIFLRRLDFAAIVTNLGRGGDPHAGTRFISELRDAVPAVVYTKDAHTEEADAARKAGATAICVLPHELIAALERI